MTSNLIQKYISKIMKQAILIFAGFLIVWIFLWNYEVFLDDLKNTGITVDEILKSNQVSRDETTRFLKKTSVINRSFFIKRN